MATFILIAGAHHGAWCFEKIVPLLEAKGHRVIAPDLPGMGSDRTPLKDVSFEGWGRFVAGIAEAQDEKVVLVGHSRGGIVISQAAEYAPDAIARLVYLTAGLARNGETMIEAAFGPGYTPELSKNRPINPDGVSSSIAHDQAAPAFYNLTDPDLVARALSLLTPEPNFSMVARVSLTDGKYGRVPRTYIECLRDNALSIDVQRRMQAQLPCERVIAIDTDHSPFYSAPVELADALDSLAADVHTAV
jgi:pimeloyl-ACP methyl ester carboxylesterase